MGATKVSSDINSDPSFERCSMGKSLLLLGKGQQHQFFISSLTASVLEC